MKEDVNILIVDDEEIMRSLFTDILQEEGYKVTVVANGKEAVDKVKETHFELVFIDMHMPVMDGVQTLHAIKEISPKTAIVTMDSMPGYVLEESKKQGALTCIHKPFDIKEVRSVVSEIINKG